MNISGYAFTSDWEIKSEENYNRYEEVVKILKDKIVKFIKKPMYGKTTFSLEVEDGVGISELDAALYADTGNLCFGGNCYRQGNVFTGCYYID